MIHTHPDPLKARAFSYTLVILEHPAQVAREAAANAAGESPPEAPPSRD